MRTSDDNKEIIKEWSRPSENEREEIHKDKGRPELVSEEADNKRTIMLGATIRLKIEIEKELMEEREKKKNSQEEYAA